MKIDTNTLLLIGAAAVGVYLITKPKTPVYTSAYNPYNTPAYNPALLPGGTQYAGNATAQDISAGASALSSLSDIIGNFF